MGGLSWHLIFWSALFVSGKVVRWEGGKGGMVLKWKGGKGGRVMRWKMGKVREGNEAAR